MSIELVTGYQGAVHVTASQDADLYRGIFGKTGILKVGNEMKVSIITANQLSIADGICIIDGRECSIGYGETENIKLLSGTQGYYRNDIVALVYSKDTNTGVESVKFEVIQGTPVTSDPVDPSYTDSDIRTEIYTSEKPFCRVRLNGVSIDGIDMLIDTLSNIESNLERIESLESNTEMLTHSGASRANSYIDEKNLGTEYTDEQSEDVSSGNFEIVRTGGYWIINGHKWWCGHADYALNCGDTKLTKHHMLVFPDACLYTMQMNTSNTTDGGYSGCAGKTSGLTEAIAIAKADFGEDHVLTRRVLLANAVSSGKTSGWAWYDSEGDLMNERMVYGSASWDIQNGNGYNVGADKTPIALFVARPDLICNRENWWLRDSVSSSSFADVSAYGASGYSYASYSYGVRPAFLIC